MSQKVPPPPDLIVRPGAYWLSPSGKFHRANPTHVKFVWDYLVDKTIAHSSFEKGDDCLYEYAFKKGWTRVKVYDPVLPGSIRYLAIDRDSAGNLGRAIEYAISMALESDCNAVIRGWSGDKLWELEKPPSS